MVNTQVLQGQWNQVRGQLKKKWGQLTDDDLRFANGNLDQLIGRIQQKTGEARDAVEGFLDEVTSHGASAISQAAETASQVARQAAEGAREGYNRVAEQAREGYNRISGEFERGYEVSRDYVRQNPARSVGTAFGVGVLLGVVVGLALRSR
jgi:uncharacterized protein YjbJ (UPF0337 family)/tetrahydromethanopterin S-methyltransferase subunit G